MKNKMIRFDDSFLKDLNEVDKDRFGNLLTRLCKIVNQFDIDIVAPKFEKDELSWVSIKRMKTLYFYFDSDSFSDETELVMGFIHDVKGRTISYPSDEAIAERIRWILV